MGRLVACSARIAADRQTDRHTHTQTKYRNPHRACAPKVNNHKEDVCQNYLQLKTVSL